MQIETKEDSLGVRDGSFETESHQQQLRQSLDRGPERRRRAVHPPLGEESGSQLAARLNSSAFGTEQVTLRAQCAHATCGSCFVPPDHGLGWQAQQAHHEREAGVLESSADESQA